MTSTFCSQSSSSEDEEGNNTTTDCNEAKLETFKFTVHKTENIINNIDPGIIFFNNVNINCNYYMDSQFKRMIKSDLILSIIHFNSRSLYANLHHIKEYLNHFNTPFNITAISENWIKPDK